MAARCLALAALALFACEPIDWAGDTEVAGTPSFSASSAPEAPPPAPPSILRDDEDAALDARPARRSPRDAALIVAEAKGLQSLIESTPNGTANKPTLLRRLAEDYVELGASATAAGNVAVAKTAHEAAVGMYTALLQAPFDPPYPRSDEARFYLALEEARAGDVEAARRGALDVLAHAHQGVWASRARFLLAAALATSPAGQTLADQTFDRASRSSDPALAKLAARRLGRTGEALVASRAPPPPPVQAVEATPAAPSPRPAPSAARACALDMECDGANVCRNGVCVHL